MMSCILKLVCVCVGGGFSGLQTDVANEHTVLILTLITTAVRHSHDINLAWSNGTK